MGNIEGDFEKGEADGSRDALELITATAKTWLYRMENQKNRAFAAMKIYQDLLLLKTNKK